MLGAWKRGWWVSLIIAVFAIVLGLAAILAPIATIAAWVLVWALFVIVGGIVGIISAFVTRKGNRGWWLELIWGLLGVLVGGYILMHPSVGALILVILVGIWAIIGGVVDIVRGFQLRGLLQGWGWMLASGACWIVLGLLFIAAPEMAATITTQIIGIFIMLLGIVSVISLGFLRRDLNRLDAQTLLAAM